MKARLDRRREYVKKRLKRDGIVVTLCMSIYRKCIYFKDSQMVLTGFIARDLCCNSINRNLYIMIVYMGAN